MRRCSAVQQTCRSWQAKRWTSYDRSTLTDEALLSRIESNLGKDEQGNPMRIDTDKKTISTAAGELPISPLFAPSWIRSRKRATKEQAGSPTGRFRRKLIRNPFARALASPIRTCTMTHIRLPRFFLQDFEAVNHPKTGEMWMAAGPLAFENVQPKYRPLEGGEAEITVDGEQSNENPAPIESQSNDLDGKLTDDTATSTSLSPSKSSPEENSSSITDGEVPERTSKAPITVYTLTNRSLFDKIGKERRHVGKLIGGRSGMAYMPVSRAAVFRHDMGDVILKMMRQTLVDALVARSTSSVSGSPGTQIERIESWDDARNVKERGSVLLLSGDDTEAIKAGSDVTEPFPAYLTLDVDGASYDRKIPVYDLNRLLGAEEVARLRGSAPAVFGRNETQGRSGQQKYVLKRKSSHSSTNLHLLLWRIEGYLAETRAPASSA